MTVSAHSNPAGAASDETLRDFIRSVSQHQVDDDFGTPFINGTAQASLLAGGPLLVPHGLVDVGDLIILEATIVHANLSTSGTFHLTVTVGGNAILDTTSTTLTTGAGEIGSNKVLRSLMKVHAVGNESPLVRCSSTLLSSKGVAANECDLIAADSAVFSTDLGTVSVPTPFVFDPRVGWPIDILGTMSNVAGAMRLVSATLTRIPAAAA